MKKIDKAKAWIIHKLGGKTKEDIEYADHLNQIILTPIVQNFRPVTLSAKSVISKEEIMSADKDYIDEVVANQLCHKISDELFKNIGTLVKIQQEENIQAGGFEVTALIRVLERND